MTAIDGRPAAQPGADTAAIPDFDGSELPALKLLAVQGDIIDKMASGAGLRETLEHIAILVERLAPPALCSILLLQPDGRHMRPAAAPSLPEPFCQAVDGLEIGPCCGSCGTAAFRKQPVIVSDIATDPLWAGPREFTLSFGLRACWSMPILNDAGVVLGTIAMYYREPRAPTGRDWGLLEPASRLVRLALAQNRKEEELRDSEARWQLAAEASRLGTFDVDLLTRRDVWSAQFKAILGLSESTTPSASLFVSQLHPDDRDRFERKFNPVSGLTPELSPDEVFRAVRADTGEEIVVRLRGRVVTNGDGVPTRAIGTLADITQDRRREHELARATLAAQKASKAKSEFLASMSHELRTPLNAIIGFSDVIRMGTFGPLSPAKYAEYVEDIHKSGRHLLSLINDVLDMAKIEAGKLELDRRSMRIAPVGASALRLVERQAAAVGLALASRIDEDLAVMADERAITQILVNLLSNSVKFTKPGGTVTLFAARAADGGVSLGVEDTGVGMSPEGLRAALEPFGQAERSFTVEGRGTGLGLPLAKALIEAHDAVFRIETVLGQGTRVWAEFPARSVVAGHERAA